MTNPSPLQPAFPDLETERLLLRQLTLADTDFVFQQFSDPLVTRYLMDEPPLSDRAGAEEIIRYFADPDGKRQVRWGLQRKADGRLIGTCGFHHWEKAYFHAEMGYDLTPPCWGQGYMREALPAIIGHAFTRMGLNRIEALVYVDNPASYRLLEGLGFLREGRLRDFFCLNGVFYDHYLYSLLRRDWPAQQESQDAPATRPPG